MQKLFGVFVLILLLSSCAPRKPTPNSDLATPLTNGPDTQTQSIAISPTANFIRTRTETPTFRVTTTPRPTLEAKEREDFLQDLMNSNGGCQLPCWWGVTPGKTTWQEAEQLFHVMGLNTQSTPSSTRPAAHFRWVSIKFEEKPLYEALGFYEQEMRIDGILVSGNSDYHPTGFQSLWDHYSPDRLLGTFEVPSRVFLRAPGVTGIGNRGKKGYILWIFYDHLGFMVRYDGEVDDLPIYHICPSVSETGSRIFRIDISMQSPNAPYDLADYDGILIDEKGSDTVKTIDEAAGMSVEEFYSIFTNKDKPACFDTPHDIWPKK